jgi:hypothetical protein
LTTSVRAVRGGSRGGYVPASRSVCWAGPASAATPTVGSPITVSGTGENGKKFTGVYTIQRFARAGDEVVAVGVITGKLKNRRVTRRKVKWPVAVTDAAPTARAAQTTPPIPPTPNACQVLNPGAPAYDHDPLAAGEGPARRPAPPPALSGAR